MRRPPWPRRGDEPLRGWRAPTRRPHPGLPASHRDEGAARGGRARRVRRSRSRTPLRTTPHRDDGSEARRPSARAAERLASEPTVRLSITSTRCPSASSRSTRCEPMKPAPPTTTTFTATDRSADDPLRGTDHESDDGRAAEINESPAATVASAPTIASRTTAARSDRAHHQRSLDDGIGPDRCSREEHRVDHRGAGGDRAPRCR